MATAFPGRFEEERRGAVIRSATEKLSGTLLRTVSGWVLRRVLGSAVLMLSVFFLHTPQQQILQFCLTFKTGTH